MELKACPFCAYWELTVEAIGRDGPTEFRVGCLNCGATGPNDVTPQRAMQMWNLRRTVHPSEEREESGEDHTG